MNHPFLNEPSIAIKFRGISSKMHGGIIAALKEETDPHRGIHDARRNIKMNRALLRLFRFELGETRYRKENIFYRDVGRRLSFLRDLTAMLETLIQIEEEFHFMTGKKIPQILRERLHDRRARFIKENADVASAEVSVLIQKSPILNDWKGSENYFALILKGIKKTFNRGRKDAILAKQHRLPFYVHDWRKRAKYLRYQFKILEDIDVAKFSSIEKELHRLTDLLGDFNNLNVLMEMLPEMNLPLNDQKVIRLVHFMFEKQENLLDEALPLGKKIYADPAHKFEKKLRKYLGVRVSKK